MEDEIGSISSVIGASWAGAKAMTATSGPGISLMTEGIGYAVITETPCVIVDVQRAGPSTGQATRPGQGDVMQVKWGPHGDNEIVAFAPWSVQEMYDLTIKAFNFAERFRVPAFVLADEAVGHLRETLVVSRGSGGLRPLQGPRVCPPFGTDDPQRRSAHAGLRRRGQPAGHRLHPRPLGLPQDRRLRRPGPPDRTIGSQGPGF